MSKLYIVETLRAYMRARRITYAELAVGLDLSESSIKRMFAGSEMSLDRLEKICGFLQIEMADLFRSAPSSRKLISSLSHSQEQELVNNKALLVVAVCALNYWTLQDMDRHLTLTSDDLKQHLKTLQSIGFLEFDEGRQIRLLVTQNFNWIRGGPIMGMVQGLSHEFFNDNFDANGEILRIINVRLTKASQIQLQQRLERIAQEYVNQARAESHLPIQERAPTSVCIAARAWIPQFIVDFVKWPTHHTKVDAAKGRLHRMR